MAKDFLKIIDEELFTPTEIDEFVTELTSEEYELLIAIAKTCVVLIDKDVLYKRRSHCEEFCHDLTLKMDYVLKSRPYYEGGTEVYTTGIKGGYNPEHRCNYDLDALPSNTDVAFESENFEWRKY